MSFGQILAKYFLVKLDFLVNSTNEEDNLELMTIINSLHFLTKYCEEFTLQMDTVDNKYDQTLKISLPSIISEGSLGQGQGGYADRFILLIHKIIKQKMLLRVDQQEQKQNEINELKVLQIFTQMAAQLKNLSQMASLTLLDLAKLLIEYRQNSQQKGHNTENSQLFEKIHDENFSQLQLLYELRSAVHTITRIIREIEKRLKRVLSKDQFQTDQKLMINNNVAGEQQKQITQKVGGLVDNLSSISKSTFQDLMVGFSLKQTVFVNGLPDLQKQ
eukprot:403337079